MKKSITTRIKVTKTGKMLRRKMAQGHFRAGKAGKSIRQKRGLTKVSKVDQDNLESYKVRTHSKI